MDNDASYWNLSRSPYYSFIFTLPLFAVYEIMVCSDEIKEFVLNGASTLELKREAIRQGMQTLRMAALGKLKEGETSMDEVARSTAPD